MGGFGLEKMATSLVKNSLPRVCRVLTASRGSIAPVITRSYAGAWNKDWRPDPKIPETEEEMAAAAKKYGLLREDYKPFDKDAFQTFGDYPDLPYTYPEMKDPYEDWDLPEYKRNYGEPMHVDADALVADRWEPGKDYGVPYNTMLLTFLGTVGSIMFLHFFFYDKPHFNPALPKQFPADGKKHYTFEPLD